MTLTFDYDLGPDHDELRRTVERFARQEVAPRWIGEYYEKDEFPYQVVEKMSCSVCSGCPSPKSTAAWAATSSLSASHSKSSPGSTRRSRSPSKPRSGSVRCRSSTSATTSRKSAFYRRCAVVSVWRRSDSLEPGGGTDAGATRTTAVLQGDEWVINGSKAFITNAGTDITSFVTITAITSLPSDQRASAIIVPSGTVGFTVGQRYSKVGWSASGHA